MALNEKEKTERMIKIAEKSIQELKEALDPNKIHEIPEKWKLCPGKLSHFYSLLIFHSMEESLALNEAQTKSYDELNKITHVDYFITAAYEGIEKYLFKNGMRMTDLKEIVRGDGDFVEYGSGYLVTVGKYINESFNEDEMAILEQYMNVGRYMNNKRILENVPDDFYDKPSEEHLLLRELPIELQGLKEAGNLYSFMVPLIDKFKLPKIGFVASNESWEAEGTYRGSYLSKVDTETFYSVSVLDFMENNDIRNKDDLKNYLKNIGDKFDPLKIENAPSGKKELAKKRLEKLTDDKMVNRLIEILFKANPYIKEVFKEFEMGL